MKLRKLGATGLLVSPLGLGLAALGRPGYINLGHADDLGHDHSEAAMEARAFEVLDAAHRAGVRYLDAARSYGRAEEFLGRWLATRKLPPQALVIGSKWGYTYTADWQVDAEVHEAKEHTLDVLQRQWRESRSLLGPALDLYQIHSATPASGVLDNREVLKELARLKESGIAIGLSVSGPRQAEVVTSATSLELDGRPLFDCVQATWNLLEPAAGEALKRAHQRGMGIIVKEALANGRLTTRNTEPGLAAKLVQQAARLETTVDALALAAVLAQPWADVVLSGAARPEHLLSNLCALDVAWDELADATLRAVQEPPEKYWQLRSGLAWN